MRTIALFAAAVCLCSAQTVTRKEPAHYAGTQRAPRVEARPPGLRLALRRPRELALAPLSAAERAQLAEPGTRLRIGLHRSLPADTLSLGAWEPAEDGARVWRMAIRSPGSDGLRVEFRNFDVGEGKVWLHDGSSAAGPYTGRGLYDNGSFWSATLFSELVTLEYEPASETPAGGNPPFEIRAISHQARALPQNANQAGPSDTADYCHLDPNCYPEWQGAMGMVAQISYEENGARYLCSGSLVATRDNSFKPYLLTAGHCIHSEEAARSVEVYWKYQTASCGSAPPVSREEGKSTLGGHLLASGSLTQGDYSLLLLREVPNDVTFSGWDVGDPPLGSPLAGIHHPTGSWKRISFGDRVDDKTVAIGDEIAPASRYLDVRWDRGRTEPGSSGSPLFSSPGVIVGMLTYGSSSSTLSACQINPSISGYGRFSTAYPEIRDYVENLPAAQVSPDRQDLSFAVLNHRAPEAQTVQLSTESTGASGFKLRADAPWIQLSENSGSISAGNPVSVTVTVDPALPPGAEKYSGTVTILSGAASPRFLNVTATARVDQSNVTASISPNPVYLSGGQWSFQIRLAETAGASTRVTGLRVNGVDYSAYVASWFGSDRISGSGSIEAALTAAGLWPGDQYFEFWGVDDASGQEWYRVTSANFR